MEVMSFTDLRKNLADAMDKVLSDKNPLVITRQNSEPMVLISLKDFNAYEETAHLLSSPANAQRLRRSIADAKAGRAKERDLIEVED